jgi:hypothetical protein
VRAIRDLGESSGILSGRRLISRIPQSLWFHAALPGTWVYKRLFRCSRAEHQRKRLGKRDGAGRRYVEICHDRIRLAR